MAATRMPDAYLDEVPPAFILENYLQAAHLKELCAARQHRSGRTKRESVLELVIDQPPARHALRWSDMPIPMLQFMYRRAYRVAAAPEVAGSRHALVEALLSHVEIAFEVFEDPMDDEPEGALALADSDAARAAAAAAATAGRGCVEQLFGALSVSGRTPAAARAGAEPFVDELFSARVALAPNALVRFLDVWALGARSALEALVAGRRQNFFWADPERVQSRSWDHASAACVLIAGGVYCPPECPDSYSPGGTLNARVDEEGTPVAFKACFDVKRNDATGHWWITRAAFMDAAQLAAPREQPLALPPGLGWCPQQRMFVGQPEPAARALPPSAPRVAGLLPPAHAAGHRRAREDDSDEGSARGAPSARALVVIDD